jgi:hypothetical protein
LYSFSYEAGGSGSLIFEITGSEAGLLRRVKKPTAMGITIKITDKHIKPIATGAVIGCVLDSPLTVVVNGTPASPITPAMHSPKPGQAQHKTVTIVKTIPTVLFIQPPLLFWQNRKRFYLVYNKKPCEVR